MFFQFKKEQQSLYGLTTIHARFPYENEQQAQRLIQQEIKREDPFQYSSQISLCKVLSYIG